jgi:hypothetical protein
MQSFLSLLMLFLLRIGIPLLLTYLFGKYLQRLDEKWRTEGLEQIEKIRQTRTGLPAGRCWEIRGCSPEVRDGCPAYLGTTACWEIFRSNGQLNKKCAGCEVVKQALTPVGI